MLREVRARLRACDRVWLAAFWPGGEPPACETWEDLVEWLISVSVHRTAAAADGGQVPPDLAGLFYYLGEAASRCAQLGLAEELERLAVGPRPEGYQGAG